MALAQDIDAATEEAVARFRADLSEVLQRLRAMLGELLAPDLVGRLTGRAA